MDAQLLKALVSKLSNFRPTAPVYRLRDRRVDEIEADARAFAQRFAGTYLDREPRADICRRKDVTTFRLPDGGRVAIFHASGAMLAKRGLRPLEQLITDTDDKAELTARTVAAAKRLGLDRCHDAGERLEFERLWQIKATGMTLQGERGAVALCRVVGAFRRYLADLPVLGRASVFVKLAGDNVVDGAGVDWRPIAGEPVDYAKIIEPEAGAARVLHELSIGSPGGELTLKHYEPESFALGYLSLPKRRAQGFLQPVYVVALRPRGDTTLGRIVVVPASQQHYESLCRPLAAPPRLAAKPQARAGTGAKAAQGTGCQ